MKYALKEIIINPVSPVKQSGHIQQVNPISKVHDDLIARIFALEDDKEIIIHFSCDLLSLNFDYTEEMNEYLKNHFTKKASIVLSTTHTHYAGDTENDIYKEQLIRQFKNAINELEFVEGDLSYTYQYESFEGVGTSRISNHKALVLLSLIRIYNQNNEIFDIINYNCHPTILSAVETDFFSSEYVGNSISKLNAQTNVFHTFMQGAAGDVSTRFTRTGQHYEDVENASVIFVNKINEMKKKELVKLPLNNIHYTCKDIPISFDFTDVDTSLMPNNLSARELETIGYGKIMRQRLMNAPEKLQKSMRISQIKLNNFNMIFAPNELFSYFLQQVDHEKAILTCYSNGYSPYISPLNQTIYTYETFTDVLSKDTKQKLVDTLIEYSK